MKSVIAAVVVVATLSTPAFAGERTEQPVVIRSKDRVALGAMGTARNSADGLQVIGCQLNGWNDDELELFCWARDASNQIASCSTFNPKPALLHPLSMLADNSFVRFEWSESGACVGLLVSNASAFTPPR